MLNNIIFKNFIIFIYLNISLINKIGLFIIRKKFILIIKLLINIFNL